MLDHLSAPASPDSLRLSLNAKIPRKQRSALGQFMTPANTAMFMASLFDVQEGRGCRLLDAGAGVGALTHAFLQRREAKCETGQIELTAFEIDPVLRANLEDVLDGFPTLTHCEIHGSDFIEEAVSWIEEGSPRFTHVILNPPYKKIHSASKHRAALRRVGIETVNLYSAFMGLCMELLEPGGQLVAIVPRSFCNGSYYKPFRRLLLKLCAIRRIHLFGSRNKAFRDDGVLQENVILMLERGAIQGPVTISTSTDDSMIDMLERVVPFEDVLQSDDREFFLRIPTSNDPCLLDVERSRLHLLGHLGIEVSTGPVVDFRMRDHLRSEPSSDTVPLLYPGHFQREGTIWPRREFRKPNALMLNDVTWRWLYPKGFYTVVRRLTSKEENRRVVASVVDPESFPGVELLGFENHLNVFHQKKRGLDAELAYGLTAYLNTDEVDQHFRSFNGHTQVNATDLRSMRYPSIATLRRMGAAALLTLRGTPVSNAVRPESLTA
jgi:adenine-specific DNA-methyltransferase